MRDYTFEARDSQGEVQRGSISAATVGEAIEQLTARGFEVTAIHLSALIPTAIAPADLEFHQRLERVIAHRQEWLPVLEAMAAESPQGVSKRETQGLLERLRGPLSADQLIANPRSMELLPLLTGGMESSSDARRLQQWLSDVCSASEQRTRARKRLIYPLLLLALTITILVFFSIFLLPIFRSMYDDFGLQLPASTELVFWIGDQLTTHALRSLACVVGGLAIAVPLIYFWRKRALTNRLLGRWVAGTSANLRAMSTLTSTLAELLSLGMPTDKALPLAGLASQHRYFADATVLLADLNSPEAASAVAMRLPRSVIAALRMGAGERPSIPLLRELSTIYSEIAQSRQDRFSSALPLLGVVLLGVLVGFVVVSMFMPLVSLVTALS